jgi:hypothetical protein
VNGNTRGQWERYCAEHPELTGVEVAVLYWLVHMHGAAEGITRPGERRLAKVTHFANTTVGRAMQTLTAKGAIRLVMSYPKGGRKADEYAIPWLRNLPAGQTAQNGQVVHRADVAPVIAGSNAGANAGTSSPLRGEQRGAPRRAGAHAAALPPGDAVAACSRCGDFGWVTVDPAKRVMAPCPDCRSEAAT